MWRNGVEWVDLCETCTRPKSMVAMAERGLPEDMTEVIRCRGCGRVLMYRSRAGIAAKAKVSAEWASRGEVTRTNAVRPYKVA
jgi:hypothetical protein